MEEQINRIIIIDSENDNISKIKGVIEQKLKSSSFSIETANSYENGISIIRQYTHSIVFLNINIGGWKKGYEIVESLNEALLISPIFISNKTLPAEEVFCKNAADFIVSPLNPNEIARALNNATMLNITKSLAEVAKTFLKIGTNVPKRKKLIIKGRNDWHILSINEITHIEAVGSYCNIYLMDGRVVKSSKNMKYYEDFISDPDNFRKVHKSFIVNTEHTIGFDTKSKKMMMVNNIEIPVILNFKELHAIFGAEID